MFFCLELIICKNFAVLVNTSKDFTNYRHSSNLLIFNKILLDNNFTEDDIIYLLQEDVTQDLRNQSKGKFYIDEEVGFPIKIKTTNITLNLLLNILRCNHKKMYNLDESSNLFIYLSGHGGDEFLKILDRNFLYKDDLMEAIQYLAKRLNKVLLIVDTCQAETLVDDLPENVFVISSSKKGEPSISHCVNSRIGCSVIDGLPKIFYDEYVNNQENKFIEDFVKQLTYEKVGSTVKTRGIEQNFYLNDFFKQNISEKKQKICKFKL